MFNDGQGFNFNNINKNGNPDRFGACTFCGCNGEHNHQHDEDGESFMMDFEINDPDSLVDEFTEQIIACKHQEEVREVLGVLWNKAYECALTNDIQDKMELIMQMRMGGE